MSQLIWVAVIAGAILLFWLPVIVAAIRRTDPLWPVVLLVLGTGAGGVTWFAAWWAVFSFPRRAPAPPPQPVLPPPPVPVPWWEDPKYLYGGVPPEGSTGHH